MSGPEFPSMSFSWPILPSFAPKMVREVWAVIHSWKLFANPEPFDHETFVRYFTAFGEQFQNIETVL
jgi:hypothetical protein